LFAYPGHVAPFPGSGLGSIVLDRDEALVGRSIELASLVTKARGAPLLRPYLLVQCNGSPPCRSGEQNANYLAAEGTAIVHEHATKEGGTFAVELWNVTLQRNIADTGVELSDDPKDCLSASRLYLTGPVHDVTERCGTPELATDKSAYFACTLAASAMNP
jgi:hypothetical protein